MKKIVPVILLFLLPFAAVSQRVVKRDLSHLATIVFPDTPIVEKINGGPFYYVNKGSILYEASLSDIHLSFADNFKSHFTDSIYATVISTFLKRHGAKLIYKNNILINNLKGIEYAVITQKDSTNYYRYHRVLYFNKKLIVYGVTSFDSLRGNKKELYDFYATFKVTAPNSDRSQETIADTLFNFKAVMWAAIALLAGVLIIFTIKKLV